MATTRGLTGLGTPPATAGVTVGQTATVTATGSSSQSAAAVLPFGPAHFNVNSGAGNTGVIFNPATTATGLNYSPGDNGTIVNTTGNTIQVYPPTGGKINNGSANAGVNLTSNQKAVWWTLDGTNFWLLIV